MFLNKVDMVDDEELLELVEMEVRHSACSTVQFCIPFHASCLLADDDVMLSVGPARYESSWTSTSSTAMAPRLCLAQRCRPSTASAKTLERMLF